MSEHPKRVAVFGAASYLGEFVVQEFLSHEWHVNAVLKSGLSEHAEALHKLKRSGRNLKLYEADVLEDSDAMRQSLETSLVDCSAVVHCAFRSYYDVVEPDRREEELVTKAVETTRAIANACARAPHIRRVIMASTIEAAIGTPREDETLPHGHPHYTFTEEDEADVAKLREDGSAAAMRTAGMALAEKAMQEILTACEGKGPETVTLLLGHPVGPLLDDAHKTDSFLRDELLPLMNGSAKRVPRGFVHLVHVADAAKAVRLLVDRPPCLDPRFLCAAKSVEWADLCRMLKELLREDLREGVPHEMGEGEDPYRLKYSCYKLEEIGFKFEYDVHQMLSDFVCSALEVGALAPRRSSGVTPSKSLAVGNDEASPADLKTVTPQF